MGLDPPSHRFDGPVELSAEVADAPKPAMATARLRLAGGSPAESG
jgi:hypothetical protein